MYTVAVIPDTTIAEIRERTDIASLVGEYVRLQKSGASFKGLCPFHSEKTPSFYVHPKRGFFHCFGCQASGDAFSFLTSLEGIPFPEAARRLAARVGVEIPESDAQEEAQRRRVKRREDRLASVVDFAAGFFRKRFAGDDASEARHMCDARGLSAESIETFRLGFAPNAWAELASALDSQGFSSEDAEAVGLISPRRGSGHYDRFRNRLMFPIADHQGRIVAFSGRALPGDDRGGEPPAKYINSPEGPLYTKGRVLFGLHEGRVEIRRTGIALLCEGNFDLLKLHQAGFGNAVAPMGTALTEDQAKLLKRFADTVILLFDGDRAGSAAVWKAHPILATAGLTTKVVQLPDGDDPDSFLSRVGDAALRERVDNAPSVVDHLIDDGARRTAGDPPAKAEAIERLGPILAALDSPVEMRLYMERVAQRFEVRDLEAVKRQLRRGVQRSRNTSTRRQIARGNDSRHFKAENEPKMAQKTRRRAPPDPMAQELVGVFLDLPELTQTPEAERFGELLTDPDLRAIFDSTLRQMGAVGKLEAASLSSEVEDNKVRTWLEGRLVQPVYTELRDGERVLRAGLPRLEVRKLTQAASQLGRLALDARSQGDDSRADELTQQMRQLQKRAVALQRTPTDD